MLSGVKYIPRDQIKHIKNNSDDAIQVRKGESSKRSGKTGRRSKKDDFVSSEDEYVQKLNSRLKQKKKWYASDPSSASSSEEDEESRGEESNDGERIQRKRDKRKKHGQRKKSKFSSRKVEERSTKPKSKKDDSSEASLSNFENTDSSNDEETMLEKYHPEERDNKKQVNIRLSNGEKVRMVMGMQWMLGPMHRQEAGEAAKQDDIKEEPKVQEAEEKPNTKELNPYLKNNGSGYPEETSCAEPDQEQPVSLPIVGDGGASWRLKALKRAKEQAAREGRKLDEVVEERWGSLGQMTLSAARNRPAPSHAHLHAIQDRKRGSMENIGQPTDSYQPKGRGGERIRTTKRDYLKGISVRYPDMREPKANGSLSWRRSKDVNKSEFEVELISSAAHGLNKFANDGTFLQSFSDPKDKDVEEVATDFPANASDEVSTTDQTMSANHLAAKVLQLRMKGKHEEAEKLLKESERLEDAVKVDRKSFSMSTLSRSGLTGVGVRKKEEDADMHLAMKIMQNKQYKASDSADEYDYDLVIKSKKKQTAMGDHASVKHQNVQKRIMTQQERCQFCFENPNRPKHLIVSIGNLSYLMLPPWKPVVDGHCCILPMQHESSTRNLDDDAWDELRNFKKCLLRMFAEEEKEVIFLETATALSQQRRHCLVECIPLPHAIAKEAPLYFKKAIDEAEDEWSQHNAKKLIDTSLKGGLRNSIPKNFPYFHVEFGLLRGFVHVIDDEKNFKSSMGLDVIRGMLQLPEEDMHRRRQYSSMEMQKNDVSRFSRAWAPFDWTKALD